MTIRSILPTLYLLLLAAIGCSDPTLPHREQLALCILKSNAPLDLDLDSIPPEMHRMHLGAANAQRATLLLEKFLATSPPLDSEVLKMVTAYAETERLLHNQFKSAISDQRPELTEEESATVQKGALAVMILQEEICKRIDFDSLVKTSP